MEYFLLEENSELTNKIKINFEKDEFNKDEPFILNLKTEKYVQFQDYIVGKNIFKYYFCVSDKFYEIMSAYEDFENVPFFITDIENKIQKPYFKINIDEIDCLESKENQTNKNITLYKHKIKDKHIFKIKYNTIEKLVISIHLAENLLKSLPYGIKLIPVQIK